MRIGIDVGGSHIGLGLVNKDGKLVLKDEKDYDKRQEDMSNIVLETIIELINKNIDNNNTKSIKYAIVYRGTDGINDISTNPTALLDMRRLLLTHTLELRLSLYRDFALHLCGLSFLCHR